MVAPRVEATPPRTERFAPPLLQHAEPSTSDGRARSETRASTETGGAAAAPSRRKWLWITGAIGAAALGVVLALAAGREPSPPPRAHGADSAEKSANVHGVAGAPLATEHSPAAQTTDETDSEAPPVAPARVRSIEPAASPPAADPPVASTAAPETAPARITKPGTRPVKRLGGKRVVVEYTERASDVAAPGLVAQAAEDPAVARARTAYLSGNQKLFTGDVDGAIAAYREALEIYPGYVGGYRGLGLAYAQRGDTEKALAAFKTYVSAVPGAKDIGLIKKRIARLQGK
jgi:hypothetical protein